MTLVGDREVASQLSAEGRSLEIPLPWILAILLRHRWVIVAFGGTGLAFAVLIASLKEPIYAASFAFIPRTPQDQARGGLASIAGQLGLPVGAIGGGSQPPELYANLLEGRELLATLAADSFKVETMDRRRVPVAEFLGIKAANNAIRQERTFRALRDRVVSSSVASRTTGAVNVVIRTTSPSASLSIAAGLLGALHEYNRITRQTQAGEERRFAAARLAEARAALRQAEDVLQGFLQRNRQFASPQLTFEQDRLQREVHLQQQLVIGLSQQFEDARIREVRDTPVIMVLEHPVLPALPEPQHRLRLLVLLGALGALMGMVWVLMREGWQRRRATADDPSYEMLANEWRRFGRMFKRSAGSG
jgi:uncharacterized protein involved in exopolysaccharide biosynthesis